MQAKWILIIYCMGLVFFAFNKILLSFFYSLKDTSSATIASAVAAAINLSVDLVSLYFNNIYGIAAATVASGVGMTIVSLYFLHTRHNISFFAARYLKFLIKFFTQFALIAGIFSILFYGSEVLLGSLWQDSKLWSILIFWIRFSVASIICAYLHYTTRHFFKIKLHFID